MVTSIQLDPEDEARLSALAERTGRTKAFYLRELISSGLTDLEDYYLGQEGLEPIRKGEERVLTSKEFWSGLDD